MEKKSPSQSSVSRRGFFRSATTAVAVGSALAGPSLIARNVYGKSGGSNGVDATRAIEAAEIRNAAAARHLEYTNALSAQLTSGDDERYADEKYYACFTKTMPHNSFGEVFTNSYESLMSACASGDPTDFDSIPLAPTAVRGLANPQGALRYIFAGLDGHATRMLPAPAFRSAEAAAEMGEVYWLALTREVPFTQYGLNRLIGAAVSDLNRFSETVGPTGARGRVNPQTLFRGETPGDLAGPYISQFLWKDVPYGPSTIVQQYAEPTSGDFMLTNSSWVAIQRGEAPTTGTAYTGNARYIYNNRMLGEYVHGDVLFQAYFNAMLIALGYGSDAIGVGNPYGSVIDNQGGFTSLGGPWFIDLLTQAGNLALNGAWCHKWIHHRRCRPEVYAGRVHHHIRGNRTYELHEDILNSAVIDRIASLNGSHFLPMAYPEGSPTHPSYPAGHATVAGACATVLKAVFNEDFVIPDPVISRDGTALESYTGDALTLGGEFNKLANNIALGRDAAGVHYRSDGVQGIYVGEQQAIALLQDYSTALNEEFGGFQFTKFDGTFITIINGQVIDS